jgi:hypothetical protein
MSTAHAQADDDIDISDTLIAKSDQLNGADLLGGSITVQILEARRTDNDKQPLILRISGGHMPYKPSKGMRRLMASVWGTPKSKKWVGKWLVLYREPDVNYGKVDGIGGVRVCGASDIAGPVNVTLQERRGVWKTYIVEPIRPPQQRQQGAATANMDKLLAESELLPADVDRWLATKNKPLLGARSPESVAELAGWLAANSKRLDEVRALVPDVDDADDDDLDDDPPSSDTGDDDNAP